MNRIGEIFIYIDKGDKDKMPLEIEGYPCHSGVQSTFVCSNNRTNDKLFDISYGDEFILIDKYNHALDNELMICLYHKKSDKTAVFYKSRIGQNFIKKSINYNDYWAKLNEV